MKTSNLSFKLTVFLAAVIAITVAISGGMYAVLQTVQRQNGVRTERLLAAKNTAYQLLEAVVDAQAGLQNTLRLKDPDEIEKNIEHFKADTEAVQRKIAGTSDLPRAVGEKFSALVEVDQKAIEQFLRGDNGPAFELMITVAPLRFEALLQQVHAYGEQVESAMKTEAVQARAALDRLLLLAAAGCGALVTILVLYGWRFRHQTARQLRGLADSLGEASAQVAAAAGQVSSSSQSLAQGSTEQASSLEETSASLEEMAGMTKRNAENAANANELATQARVAADAGVTDMRAMSTAMDDIKTSSDDIAKIIKTIDEIAFQTNILALNAAVEAARAGEAGMGFAVVAEEVRNLAHRSAQAAKETAAKIEGAITKTGQGVQISTKVAKTLGEIVDKVRQVDVLVREVATASREQSQGIEQVNQAVSAMDKVVQSNAAAAEESAGASEQLNAQAGALEDAVAELATLVGGVARHVELSPEPRRREAANAGAVAPAKTRSPVAGRTQRACPKREGSPAEKESLNLPQGTRGAMALELQNS